MAYLITKDPLEKNHQKFINILVNQNLIKDIDSCNNYTKECLFDDLCAALKTDKCMNEKSLLKTVLKLDFVMEMIFTFLFNFR